MAIPVYRLPPPQLELVSVTWAHPGNAGGAPTAPGAPPIPILIDLGGAVGRANVPYGLDPKTGDNVTVVRTGQTYLVSAIVQRAADLTTQGDTA